MKGMYAAIGVALVVGLSEGWLGLKFFNWKFGVHQKDAEMYRDHQRQVDYEDYPPEVMGVSK